MLILRLHPLPSLLLLHRRPLPILLLLHRPPLTLVHFHRHPLPTLVLLLCYRLPTLLLGRIPITALFLPIQEVNNPSLRGNDRIVGSLHRLNANGTDQYMDAVLPIRDLPTHYS